MLSLFGFLAVSIMLVAYAFEDRARSLTLVFAIGCFASALYGYLAGTLPFAIVEAIWGIVAINKWIKRKPSDGKYE